MRELKNPHRIIYMSEGRSKEITLMNQKGQQLTIDPTDFPIGDRTSNGSFAMDEKKVEKSSKLSMLLRFSSSRNCCSILMKRRHLY